MRQKEAQTGYRIFVVVAVVSVLAFAGIRAFMTRSAEHTHDASDLGTQALNPAVASTTAL
jgi:hypothetical protein